MEILADNWFICLSLVAALGFMLTLGIVSINDAMRKD